MNEIREKSWELNHEINDPSGITVRINKLDLKKPIYSFELGVLKDGGYLNRFFPGGLSWDVDFTSIISDLVEQACQYIHEQNLKEAEASAKIESERIKSKKIKSVKNNDTKVKSK